MLLTELQEALRPIARERIATGHLPREESSRMWNGYGTGELCSLCDKPIDRYQLEYQIELEGATVQRFRFHTVCHSIWQLECAAPAAEIGNQTGK